MSLNKRVKGDFLIESVTEFDSVVIKSQDIIIQGIDRFTDGLPAPTDIVNTVTIDGNLIVTGNTDTIASTNTSIADNELVLNSGETGAGVSLDTAGIIIDRGSSADASIRFSESAGGWEATDDGTTYYNLDAIGSGFDLVSDLTPQLGADLDVNGFKIKSALDGDVIITANGTGQVKIARHISMLEQDSVLDTGTNPNDPLPTTDFNKFYAKSVVGAGGTGLYFVNSTTSDELVSRKKAILFGLIF